MRCQRAYEGFTQIAQQVPAVSNLRGLGRRSHCGLRINAGPITAHNLDSRMSPQPCRRAVHAAIRQQVDRLAFLKIAENRAVTVTFTPCPSTVSVELIRWPECPVVAPNDSLQIHPVPT
jgi:hypothetical protein